MLNTGSWSYATFVREGDKMDVIQPTVTPGVLGSVTRTT